MVFGRIAFSQLSRIAAVDQRAFDAVFRRQRLDHPAAGAEQGAGCDDMVAGLELAEDRGGDGRHAGCRGARIFGAFQHAHALFEHVVGRAAVAGIDEAVRLALEARFGRFRAVIDEALRQEDRFGGFTIVRTDACRHGRVVLPGARSCSCDHHLQKQKNRPQKQAGFEPGLFSYLFNVAASRPAKSPRDKSAYTAVSVLASIPRVWFCRPAKMDEANGSRNRHSGGSRDLRRCSTTGRLKREATLDCRPDPAGKPRSAPRLQGLSRARQLHARPVASGRRQARPAEDCMSSISPKARCSKPAASISCR